MMNQKISSDYLKERNTTKHAKDFRVFTSNIVRFKTRRSLQYLLQFAHTNLKPTIPFGPVIPRHFKCQMRGNVYFHKVQFETRSLSESRSLIKGTQVTYRIRGQSLFANDAKSRR